MSIIRNSQLNFQSKEVFVGGPNLWRTSRWTIMMNSYLKRKLKLGDDMCVKSIL